MKLTFERPASDYVAVDPDGWIVTCFARSGYIKSISRVRHGRSDAVVSGAFSVSTALDNSEGKDSTAPHALVHISEEAGIEKISIVERFATVTDANAAWEKVRRATQKKVMARQLKSAAGTAWLYAVVPAVAFIVAMSAVRFMDSHNGSLASLNAIMHEAAVLRNTSQDLGASSEIENAGARLAAEGSSGGFLAEHPIASANVISAAPQQVSSDSAFASGNVPVGVPAGVIHMGLLDQPANKTLYVYSDPNCPACKRFEPHIKDLAKDFSINVLPVAFKPGSLTVAAQILCSKLPQVAWDMAMVGPAVDSLGTADCAEGYNAVTAHMKMYEALKFKVTPMVVDGNGNVFPEGATAATIRQEESKK